MKKILIAIIISLCLAASVACANILRLDNLSEIVKDHSIKDKIVLIVDYSLPIYKDRFFVFDQENKKILFKAKVGHGWKSGFFHPNDTSNRRGTKKTSLGVYRTGGTYVGKFGKSRKLYGLNKSNSNAFKRGIIIHKADYGDFGMLWSMGCFTFSDDDIEEVLKHSKKGRKMIVVD